MSRGSGSLYLRKISFTAINQLWLVNDFTLSCLTASRCSIVVSGRRHMFPKKVNVCKCIIVSIGSVHTLQGQRCCLVATALTSRSFNKYKKPETIKPVSIGTAIYHIDQLPKRSVTLRHFFPLQ